MLGLSGSSGMAGLTQTSPATAQPKSISRVSLEEALSQTQLRRSRPSRHPVSATGPDVPLSLNTLKLFEAVASLSGPIQAQQVPDLPEPQEEILIEVGDVSSSGAACTQARDLSTGRRRGDPNFSEISLPHPNPQGQASQQPLWDQDGRPVLAPPGPLVKLTSVPAGPKSHLHPQLPLGRVRIWQ